MPGRAPRARLLLLLLLLLHAARASTWARARRGRGGGRARLAPGAKREALRDRGRGPRAGGALVSV
jgi:hypothetical protein